MIAAERRSYAYSVGTAPATAAGRLSGEATRPGRNARRMASAEFGRWLATLMILTVLGAGATAAASAVTTEGYRIDRLDAALRAAQSRENTLQLEVGRAQSISAIRQRASSLGMRRPDAYQMVNPVPVHAAPQPLGHSVTVVLPPPKAPAGGRAAGLHVPVWLSRLVGLNGATGAAAARTGRARD